MEMRLFNTLLVCCYVFMTTSGSPVRCAFRYPEIDYIHESRNVRLKNVKTTKYVFMRVEGDGVVFGTKYLTPTVGNEVDFTLHSYSTGDTQGGALVLPISSDSRMFRVTDDVHLEVAALDNELPENARNLRQADSSFFRRKLAVNKGEGVIVLQAMNGCHYLAVDGDNLTLKEYSGDSSDYPEEIMFYEDDVTFSQTSSD